MRLMLDPKIDWAGAMPGSSGKLPLCWLGAWGSPMGRREEGEEKPAVVCCCGFSVFAVVGKR